MKKVMVVNRLRNVFVLIDSALFSVLMFLPIRILILKKESVIASIAICIGILGIVLALRFKAVQWNHRKKEEKQQKSRKLEKVLLKNDEEISTLLKENNFILVRKREADTFDILDAMQKGAKAIGLPIVTGDAKALVQRYRPETHLFSFEEIINHIYPDQRLASSSNEVLLERFSRFYNKYFLAGVILFFASFLFHYKLYLRLIAGVCFAFFAVQTIIKKHGRTLADIFKKGKNR